MVARGRGKRSDCSYGVSLPGDENVLGLDGSDGGMIL